MYLFTFFMYGNIVYSSANRTAAAVTAILAAVVCLIRFFCKIPKKQLDRSDYHLHYGVFGLINAVTFAFFAAFQQSRKLSGILFTLLIIFAISGIVIALLMLSNKIFSKKSKTITQGVSIGTALLCALISRGLSSVFQLKIGLTVAYGFISVFFSILCIFLIQREQESPSDNDSAKKKPDRL